MSCTFSEWVSAVALCGAVLEHRLKAVVGAGVAHNRTIIVVSEVLSVTYLNKPNRNRTIQWFLGFKKPKANRVYEN